MISYKNLFVIEKPNRTVFDRFILQASMKSLCPPSIGFIWHAQWLIKVKTIVLIFYRITFQIGRNTLFPGFQFYRSFSEGQPIQNKEVFYFSFLM